MDAERFCFKKMLDRLAVRKFEFLIVGEFWHHIVIIGVEPLGHFKRGHAMTMLIIAATTIAVRFAFTTARHSEIGLERYVAT
ncbi:hypothetical protein FQZ97_785040 [compost metagenome]